MFTVIMMSGNPCSGRTTAAGAIYDYLTDNGIATNIIYRKPGSMESQAEFIEFASFKTISKMKSLPDEQKVYIIDGAEFSAYDRDITIEMLMKTFNDLGIPTDQVRLTCVHMGRNSKFTFDHNEDENHTPYNKKTLYGMLNIMQQPIYKEGFDAIYRHYTNESLNPEDVIQNFNHVMGYTIVDIPNGKLVAAADPEPESDEGNA